MEKQHMFAMKMAGMHPSQMGLHLVPDPTDPALKPRPGPAGAKAHRDAHNDYEWDDQQQTLVMSCMALNAIEAVVAGINAVLRGGTVREEAKVAKSWIFDEPEYGNAFSFTRCCQALEDDLCRHSYDPNKGGPLQRLKGRLQSMGAGVRSAHGLRELLRAAIKRAKRTMGGHNRRRRADITLTMESVFLEIGIDPFSAINRLNERDNIDAN